MRRYRCKKLEFKAEEGTSYDVLQRDDGTVTVRAIVDIFYGLPTVLAGEYAKSLSVYTDKNGNQAVVPVGWTVSGMRRENTIWGKDLSLVIYRIPEKKVCNIDWTDTYEVEGLRRTCDQLVWTPVNLLESNGTLDGDTFNEQFGRRNFLNEKFFGKQYIEPFDGELALQKESIDKFGGYYSTRYDISKDEETGMLRSVKNAFPWICKDPNIANSLLKMFEVGAHLMYASEYDTREEWIIETGTKTRHDIVVDSTQWGNYCNNEDSLGKIAKTGSIAEWSANNIYDFTGNVNELTQEKSDNNDNIIRGGSFRKSGGKCPANRRKSYDHINDEHETGCRAVICI